MSSVNHFESRSENSYVHPFPLLSSLQLMWGRRRCSHSACSMNIIVCDHCHLRPVFAVGYLDMTPIFNPSAPCSWESPWCCCTWMCMGPCLTFKERERIKSSWASFLTSQSSRLVVFETMLPVSFAVTPWLQPVRKQTCGNLGSQRHLDRDAEMGFLVSTSDVCL